MRYQRVRCSFLRQYYATLHSPHRIFEVFFWPVVDIVLWGFLTVYLRGVTDPVAVPVGFLLGAALLWDVIFRGNLAVGVAFLEESWTRNVLNVMATPMRPSEYLAGAVALGMLKLAIGWVVAAAIAFFAYAFSVGSLGLALLPFLADVLLTGLVLGIVVLALVVRYGQGVEILAWGLAFVVLPISAVFFPVSVLPGPLQVLAHAWPASYVFEGMRSVLAGGPIPWGQLAWATVLNLIYLAAALAYARWALETLRRRGFVTRYL